MDNNQPFLPSPDQSTKGRIAASQRGLIWALSHHLDKSLTNPDVNINALGLASFGAIYSASMSLCHIMKDIQRVCEVQIGHITLSESPTEARVRFFMNGIWVSDGVDTDVKRARVAAINNSLLYLIQKKRLKITAMEFIPPEATFRVVTHMVATEEIKDNFQAVCGNISNRFKTFLNNPAFMKAEFLVGDLSPDVQGEIHTAADICKLNHQDEGATLQSKVISCWKVNSIIHNLSSKKVKQNKNGRRNKTKKASSGPSIQKKLQARNSAIKKKRNGVKRVFRRPDEQPTEDNPNYHMQVALKECMKLEMLNILRLSRGKRKQTDKINSNSSVWNNAFYGAGEQTQFAMSDMFPYDKDAINPVALEAVNFLQGFVLFCRGLTHRPEYLLRMSTLVCNYSCQFEEEPDIGSDGSITARLDFTKTKQRTRKANAKPDLIEVWLCTGKGATFEEAKEVCATNAVNFLINRGTRIFNHKKWANFVKNYHGDPDFVWEISKQDISVSFILSTSHPRISEYDPSWELLENLGWSPGLGLGKDCQGEVNPIEIWKPYSGYTGLGFESENELDESECASNQQTLEEMVVRFKNDPDVWKLALSLDDIYRGNDVKLIAQTCRKLRLNLQTNIYDEKGRKVHVWKHWYQVGMKNKESCKNTTTSSSVKEESDNADTAASTTIKAEDGDNDGEAMRDCEQESVEIDDGAIYYYDDDDDIDGEYFEGANNNDGVDFDHDGDDDDPYDEIYSPPSPVVDDFDYDEEVELGNYIDDDYGGLDGEKFNPLAAKDDKYNVDCDSQPGPSGLAMSTEPEDCNSQFDKSCPPDQTSDVVLTPYTLRLSHPRNQSIRHDQYPTPQQSNPDRPPNSRPSTPLPPFTSQYPHLRQPPYQG